MAKFKPGQSGNPNGRPTGAKTTASLIRTEMVNESDVRTIVAKVVQMAMDGDLTAAGMILDRTVPKLRPRVESIAEEAGLAEALQAARLRAASNSGYRVAVLEDWVLASHTPPPTELQVRTGVVGGLVGGDDLAPKRHVAEQTASPRTSSDYSGTSGEQDALGEPLPSAPPVMPVFRMRLEDDAGGGSYVDSDPYTHGLTNDPRKRQRAPERTR